MKKETIVYKKDKQFYIVNADKKSKREDTNIYHNLSNDCSAAKIKDNEIKILKNGKIKNAKLIGYISHVPHQIRVYGDTKNRSVNIEGVNGTDIGFVIPFPENTNESKISINESIISFNFESNLSYEIFKRGDSVITVSTLKGYIMGFNNPISTIQLRQDKFVKEFK